MLDCLDGDEATQNCLHSCRQVFITCHLLCHLLCAAEMALARAQGKESAGKGAASTTSIDPKFARQLWKKVTGISVSQAESTGLQSSNVAWHRRVCGHCSRCKKVVWEKRTTGCYRKRKPSECIFLPKVSCAGLHCAALCCAALCSAVLCSAVLWNGVWTLATVLLTIFAQKSSRYWALYSLTSCHDCVSDAFRITLNFMLTGITMNVCRGDHDAITIILLIIIPILPKMC